MDHNHLYPISFKCEACKRILESTEDIFEKSNTLVKNWE